MNPECNPPSEWGGTLTFVYYRDSDYFFGFKILNFAIVLVVKVLSTIFYGYDNLRRFFFGMSFSTGNFLGWQFTHSITS